MGSDEPLLCRRGGRVDVDIIDGRKLNDEDVVSEVDLGPPIPEGLLEAVLALVIVEADVTTVV